MDYALYDESDNSIEMICQARNSSQTIRFDATATVRVEKITDKSNATIAGTGLPGGVWPLVLTYVPAGLNGEPASPDPTGKFRGILPYQLPIVDGERYVLHGFADHGPGKRRVFKARLYVVETLRP